jgi:hypothetical protein
MLRPTWETRARVRRKSPSTRLLSLRSLRRPCVAHAVRCARGALRTVPGGHATHHRAQRVAHLAHGRGRLVNRRGGRARLRTRALSSGGTFGLAAGPVARFSASGPENPGVRRAIQSGSPLSGLRTLWDALGPQTNTNEASESRLRSTGGNETFCAELSGSSRCEGFIRPPKSDEKVLRFDSLKSERHIHF